jgi:hypothetical protein
MSKAQIDDNPTIQVITSVDGNQTKMSNNSKDPWWAPDKLYHVLFSSLATRTRYPFLRRHAIFKRLF